MQLTFWLVLGSCALLANGQFNLHHWPGRSGIVHLFEWKWLDIASECEKFLAPNGFGGVLLSPATENAVILKPNRPWWERYQPVSYYLNSRSGNEAEFAKMVSRCNAVGVRIYADVVFNQMAATPENGGTGGSSANVSALSYPAVPYNASDFNVNCQLTEQSNPADQRNCRVYGLPDLNQRSEWVRDRIVNLLNKMIVYGVAGFRVDAAKHMWPEDLRVIYSRLANLPQNQGFAANSRPFISQVVVDMDGDGISKHEYTHLGAITEFRYSETVGQFFGGLKPLAGLQNLGQDWGFPSSERAIVFVDNHVNQRGHGAGKGHTLTYKDGKNYIMANAFMLAHSYGVPRVMSSFMFNNGDQGPPADKNGAIISPAFDEAGGSCVNGWVCEHRWNPIANMIGFRNAVAGTHVTSWVDNGAYQVAFCRGNRGFIAFNLEGTDMDQIMQTCLPAGKYCDVISGKLEKGSCTGYMVEVDSFGYARVFVAAFNGYGVMAIHVNART